MKSCAEIILAELQKATVMYYYFRSFFFSSVITHTGSGRGLVVRVLDSRQWGLGTDPHTGHGSLLKLRQFHLPRFASVYSAANEYLHCWEGICDGLASSPGESVQLH